MLDEDIAFGKEMGTHKLKNIILSVYFCKLEISRIKKLRINAI